MQRVRTFDDLCKYDKIGDLDLENDTDESSMLLLWDRRDSWS